MEVTVEVIPLSDSDICEMMYIFTSSSDKYSKKNMMKEDYGTRINMYDKT